MKLITYICIGLMYLPALANAAVTASVNQTQFSQTDMIDLTIQKTGRSHSDADLSVLSQDFAVLGKSMGTSIQVINGSMSSTSTIQLQLSPKHSGQLTIPAIHWGGESTQAISISVGQQSSNTTASNLSATQNSADHVFFDIKQNKSPLYFGNARLLTVRLYTDQQLLQADLNFLSNANVNVQQLGDDKSGTEVKNGQSYQYIERQYILTPQKSGNLEIDGPVLDAQILNQNGNFGIQDPMLNQFLTNSPLANMVPTRPVHLQANSIAVEVKSKPDAISQQDWLPTSELKLTQTWDANKLEVRAGEPINLHLHLQADNMSATQLPDLTTKLQLPDGIKAYPNQAKLETKSENGKLLAIKDQDIAIIGQTAGQFKLPALELTWWDTTNNTLQKATIASRTLTILPSVNGTSATSAHNQSAPSAKSPMHVEHQQKASKDIVAIFSSWLRNGYQWLVLGVLLIVITLIYIWTKFKKTRDTATPHVNENTQNKLQNNIIKKSITRQTMLKTLEQAVNEKNAKLARGALLEWARMIWPDDPPVGLIAFANRVENIALKDLILNLDRTCYSNEIWQGDALLAAIKHWKFNIDKKIEKKLIAELYI